MSCNLADWLSPYIDGELSELEKILLEEHLLACPECRKKLNQLKILDWDLKKQFVETVVPGEALAARRAQVLAVHFSAPEAAVTQRAANFSTTALFVLQVKTMKNTISFCRYLPGSNLLRRALHRLGSSAGNSLKKRNPLIARIILG